MAIPASLLSVRARTPWCRGPRPSGGPAAVRARPDAVLKPRSAARHRCKAPSARCADRRDCYAAGEALRIGLGSPLCLPHQPRFSGLRRRDPARSRFGIPEHCAPDAMAITGGKVRASKGDKHVAAIARSVPRGLGRTRPCCTVTPCPGAFPIAFNGSPSMAAGERYADCGASWHARSGVPPPEQGGNARRHATPRLPAANSAVTPEP